MRNSVSKNVASVVRVTLEVVLQSPQTCKRMNIHISIQTHKNKALRKKTFVDVIKEDGTIETLNQLYLDLLKEFPSEEKHQEEIKETVGV